MTRKRRLVVRLSIEEYTVIDKMAQARRLPASTLARVLLLQEADRHNSSANHGSGYMGKEWKW